MLRTVPKVLVKIKAESRNLRDVLRKVSYSKKQVSPARWFGADPYDSNNLQ